MSRTAPAIDFLMFWGKAQPRQSGPKWHPIAYHCLDVAACVERILTVRPLARRQAARLFRADELAIIPLLTALAAIHDIGKFANYFQAKCPEFWPDILGPIPGDMAQTYHTRDGLCLWKASLKQTVGASLWSGEQFSLTPIVQAVMGHHGRPIGVGPHDAVGLIFKSAGRKAAEEFAAAICRLLLPAPFDASHLRQPEMLRATWWVAGLVTTADWVGSNETWFPYCAPNFDDRDLRNYWADARDRAAHAVRNAGLEPPRPAQQAAPADVIARDRLTPAQEWANSVALADGPTLFILEDATGSGKTEAAQLLIHRLVSSGRASGAFWAMPTQATANAMYDRQAKSLRALFDSAVSPAASLVLAHGQSRMHSGFRDTVIEAPGSARESARADDDDAPSEIACPAFLANSSRTALLADVGAGTVDQAILAVLPSKFNTMRLFGLAEKVLVLDEIHAYDAYMAQELKALLRFHAEFGGSVIALSATLPAGLMGDLVSEWRAAVLSSPWPSELAVNASYPLATTVSANGDVKQQELAATSWSRRTVGVRLIHDKEEAITRLLSAAEDGAAAVWVRNTVDSCREAAAILRDRGAKRVMEFHARFAQVDRQRRESDVVRCFGVDGGSERVGSILVATQVVEQSLDLDFDVMVSDLAPIDLLIQRAGRLWRHSGRRRPRRASEELVVLTPTFEANPGKDWLDGLLRNTKYVYRDASILWRTLRVLQGLQASNGIVTPTGLRDIIAQVYDDDACAPNLMDAADRAHGVASAAAATALQYVLKCADGYVGEGLLWSSDVRVPTRLGRDESIVRLGRLMPDGSIMPWARTAGADMPSWYQWALSEIRLDAKRVSMDSKPDSALETICDQIRRTWGRWEQEIPLVPLELEGERWSGSLIRGDGKMVELEYDSESGLSFVGR